MKKQTLSFIMLCLAVILIYPTNTTAQQGERWSKQKAAQWQKKHGWLRGSNFIPSSAINQLEMWQESTFDPETIDRELGWAEDIGFNAMRVYLHHAAWQQDPKGFKKRVDKYLKIADKHGISTILVIFDDVWDPTFKIGPQPKPEPGIHNSGWIRDPGDLIHEQPEHMKVLEEYVKDIVSHFGKDKRVVLWDLYNEPGNSGYKTKSLPLLKNAFKWAREVNPSQPLTAGVWSLELKELNAFQVAHSDIITYHNYSDEKDHQKWISDLQKHGRPMVCTEYMARTRGSRFENIMPLLKKNQIGAINWGMVAGKTNTIYAWDTPIKDGSEPDVWFHDIFRKDGSPYKTQEVELIKSLTGVE